MHVQAAEPCLWETQMAQFLNIEVLKKKKGHRAIYDYETTKPYPYQINADLAAELSDKTILKCKEVTM